MRDVLVCVEPGPAGLRAVSVAAELARRYGAHLVLAEATHSAAPASTGLLPVESPEPLPLQQVAQWVRRRVPRVDVCELTQPISAERGRYDLVVVGCADAAAALDHSRTPILVVH